MLNGLRGSEDPGIQPQLLAVSNAIDVPLRRRLPARPSLGEWLAVALAVIVIVAALWVTP